MKSSLFVGSTYGESGITVAVWIGHDDGQPLGDRETGGKTALPIFREIVEQIYARDVVGPAPEFPPALDRGIDTYLSEETMLMAHAEERPFVDNHEAPFAVMQGGPPTPVEHGAVSFAAAYAPPPPSGGRAAEWRARERPTRGAESWVCRRTSAGLACVAESSVPRAWLPRAPAGVTSW